MRSKHFEMHFVFAFALYWKLVPNFVLIKFLNFSLRKSNCFNLVSAVFVGNSALNQPSRRARFRLSAKVIAKNKEKMKEICIFIPFSTFVMSMVILNGQWIFLYGGLTVYSSKLGHKMTDQRKIRHLCGQNTVFICVIMSEYNHIKIYFFAF